MGAPNPPVEGEIWGQTTSQNMQLEIVAKLSPMLPPGEYIR